MKRIAIVIAALAILASPGLAAAAGEEQEARQLAAQFPNAQPHVEKALKGDPKAMRTLGTLFEVLRGDHAQAAHWYKLAALSRNARAQLLLANSYQHGRGVPKSNTLAFAWYMVASAECEQNELSPESLNGPTPSKDEWDAARETALVFRMLTLKFASEPDCSEYFDTGTKKRAVPSQRWQGFVYPDRNNLLNDRRLPEYVSLETCRKAALHMIHSNVWKNADYECGLNCRPMFPDLVDSVLVCEETRR